MSVYVLLNNSQHLLSDINNNSITLLKILFTIKNQHDKK